MALAALDFKQALANFPGGVTIVTSADAAGNPVGATVSAFTSLSLDPPLVVVCLNKDSRSAVAIVERQALAIHFLHAEQASLARRFATDGADKFDAAEYHINDSGVPCLTNVGIRLECELYALHPGGDHTIVVALVNSACLAEDFEPLIYVRRKFVTIGREVG